MRNMRFGSVVACSALAAALLSSGAFAQPAGVDAQADAVFRAMTTYLAGLKQFSARTENTIEIVTNDLQKIQFVAPASITVSRPDKLLAERRGDIEDQSFFYDGRSLTIYNPGTKHYATVAAPASIDTMLDFAAPLLERVPRLRASLALPADGHIRGASRRVLHHLLNANLDGRTLVVASNRQAEETFACPSSVEVSRFK